MLYIETESIVLYKCAILYMYCYDRYVANQLLESGDRDQLMKLIGRVQGFFLFVLVIGEN